ncbi:DDE_3 domain-containing protein [Trichonephila clavipes]|nr:DDE_3 domain-containing protein [Trichonephila clavipes]
MRGTLTGQRYVDDILRPHVGPYLNGLSGAIFQQDNARPHTARVAQDFLRHFQTLPWPARSPDLSPVGHVWDQLKWQMPSCHSVHDLELAVQDLWAHLPQDNIRFSSAAKSTGTSDRDSDIEEFVPEVSDEIIRQLFLKEDIPEIPSPGVVLTESSNEESLPEFGSESYINESELVL